MQPTKQSAWKFTDTVRTLADYCVLCPAVWKISSLVMISAQFPLREKSNNNWTFPIFPERCWCSWNKRTYQKVVFWNSATVNTSYYQWLTSTIETPLSIPQARNIHFPRKRCRQTLSIYPLSTLTWMYLHMDTFQTLKMFIAGSSGWGHFLQKSRGGQ